MFLAAGFASTSDIVFLFAAAGIVLYVASRAGADALTNLSDPSPGKLALAQWLPIAWTAVLATLAGHSEIGVGVTFASSVAALAMVLGILLCIAPAPPNRGLHTSAWPFVLPAGLLALMAGFSGTLTLVHAGMMLVLGACVLSVWRGARNMSDAAGGIAGDVPSSPPSLASAFATAPMSSSPDPRPSPSRLAAYQFLLALGLGAAGAWTAYKAVTLADERTRVATSGLIAMAVISPLLVLPMLGTGAIAAHHGRAERATAAIVGVVLLNLFLLLPLVVTAHYVSQGTLLMRSSGTTRPSLGELLQTASPMPFPLAVWRVDSVLLIVLGLMLVPVSLGRWSLRRVEGLVLTLLYAAYLIISTTIAIRV